jgi:hypothetical protein
MAGFHLASNQQNLLFGMDKRNIPGVNRNPKTEKGNYVENTGFLNFSFNPVQFPFRPEKLHLWTCERWGLLK